MGGYEAVVPGLAAHYQSSVAEALPRTGRTGISHYVRVIQGCDHTCTFFIVPSVRGREDHVPMAALVAECRRAVADGATEVVLLGQNGADYHDPSGPARLSALVLAPA